MAVAPASLLRLDHDLDARPDKPRSYQLGGIVGDARHMNPPEGYHVSARDMHFNWSTYGLNTPRDKVGGQANPDIASAWDLTMDDADMRLVTGRLITAAKNRDPRVTAVIREIAGTTNNTTVHTFYTDTREEDTANGQWDVSHLHHVHLSFFRDTVITYTKIAGVLDVVCGTQEDQVTPQDKKDIAEMAAELVVTKLLAAQAMAVDGKTHGTVEHCLAGSIAQGNDILAKVNTLLAKP